MVYSSTSRVISFTPVAQRQMRKKWQTASGPALPCKTNHENTKE
jgi:hypothetical protein